MMFTIKMISEQSGTRQTRPKPVEAMKSGKQLENDIHNRLVSLGYPVHTGDSAICKHYGKTIYYGIDHVIQLPHHIIGIQDKWEQHSVSTKTLDHLITPLRRLATDIGVEVLGCIVASMQPLSEPSQNIADVEGIESVHSSDMNELVELVYNTVRRLIVEQAYQIHQPAAQPIKPYPHQLTAFEKFKRLCESKTSKAAILRHPTGSGKSVTTLMMCGYYMEHYRKPVLWFTERKEVLASIFDTDIVERCKAARLIPSDVKVVRWDRGRRCIDNNSLIIANTDSILKSYQHIHVGMVVCDECHHLGAAATYNMVASFVGRIDVLIGVSATPIRDDRKEYITSLFNNCYLDSISYLQGVKMGLVVPVSFVWIEAVTDIRVSYSRFVEGIDVQDINNMLGCLDKIIAMSRTGKVLMRAKTCDKANEWYKLLTEIKNSYTNLKDYRLFVDHNNRKPQGAQGIKAFVEYQGKSALLVVDKCREGWDLPSLDMVINLDIVKHKGTSTLMQELGRGTRKWETSKERDEVERLGRETSKERCYYVDTLTPDSYEKRYKDILDAISGDGMGKVRVVATNNGIGFCTDKEHIPFEIIAMNIRQIAIEELVSESKPSYQRVKDLVKGLTPQQYLDIPSLPKEPWKVWDEWQGWLEFLGLDKQNYPDFKKCKRVIGDNLNVCRQYNNRGQLKSLINELRKVEPTLPDFELWKELYGKTIGQIIPP